jgi:hypothetical protein
MLNYQTNARPSVLVRFNPARACVPAPASSFPPGLIVSALAFIVPPLALIALAPLRIALAPRCASPSPGSAST